MCSSTCHKGASNRSFSNIYESIKVYNEESRESPMSSNLVNSAKHLMFRIRRSMNQNCDLAFFGGTIYSEFLWRTSNHKIFIRLGWMEWVISVESATVTKAKRGSSDWRQSLESASPWQPSWGKHNQWQWCCLSNTFLLTDPWTPSFVDAISSTHLLFNVLHVAAD